MSQHYGPLRREISTRPAGSKQLNRSELTTQIGRAELTVLAAVASGASETAAARRLHISARTLRRRLRKACDALGVEAPIEAVVWAARNRLI